MATKTVILQTIRKVKWFAHNIVTLWPMRLKKPLILIQQVFYSHLSEKIIKGLENMRCFSLTSRMLIEATSPTKPIRTVEPSTLQNIIAQKTNIIKYTVPGGTPRTNEFHIYPALNKHQENIDRVRHPYIYNRDKEINKLAEKEPQNAIRNVILKHLASSKGKFSSPSDIKYIKFLYENEQDFFKKLDTKHPVKTPSNVPYRFVISFPFSHEKAHKGKKVKNHEDQ